jgi:hypothetical protein
LNPHDVGLHSLRDFVLSRHPKRLIELGAMALDDQNHCSALVGADALAYRHTGGSIDPICFCNLN